MKNNHTLTKMYENWILWKKARFLVHFNSDLTLDLLSSWLFWIPGGIAQQASVYHGQAYDLPRQLIRKRLHQEKEQVVSTNMIFFSLGGLSSSVLIARQFLPKIMANWKSLFFSKGNFNIIWCCWFTFVIPIWKWQFAKKVHIRIFPCAK